MAKANFGFSFKAGLFAILTMVFSTAASAESEQPFAVFDGYSNNSKYTINYDDVSQFLKLVVLNTGRSNRQMASSTRAKVGTRMKSKRDRHTALEGNRINYKEIKKEGNLEVLTGIRKSLEQVPDQLEMKMLTPNEQLAYWLNLYNVALIEQVAKVFPKARLEDYLYDDDGILEEKFLKVGGVDLSLNDIQFGIVYRKFGYNPEIMYGFYQGVIGGPNIRNEAFTGKKVLQQLQWNAEEFINSNRGTFQDKRDTLRVSSMYKRSEVLFQNFKDDLRDHLLYHADSDYSYLIENAKKIRPNIKNMTINDIMGGYREYGASANTNSAALLSLEGNVGLVGGVGGVSAVNITDIAEQFQSINKNYGRFPAEMVDVLQKMNANSKVKEGQVILSKDEDEN